LTDGFTAHVQILFTRAMTRFPTPMTGPIERGCTRAAANAGEGVPIRLTSGAFHDAMYVVDLCLTAMFFVPGRAGISDNSAEHTEPHQLYLGARVLAYVVAELASR
jgi:N-carbamoyl-L-amino-acid hydrolase